MKQTRFRWLLTCLIAFSPFRASAHDTDPQAGDAQILAWFRELEPLPKVHYSWPYPVSRLHSEDLLTLEYVRITHAICLRGETCGKGEIDAAVLLCKKVNDANPEIPATIGVNFSVWHRRFGKELPPTDEGPTHQAELDLLREHCEYIRNRVAAVNQILGSDVRVSAVLFDCERFAARPNDVAWNAAITRKHDLAYDIAAECFPGARIEWFSRGQVRPAAVEAGWSQAPYCTLDEKGATFACSLYHVPEIEVTRETFRRTAEAAEKHGVHEVTPWVALASGWRRQPGTLKFTWSLEWDYDLVYSWLLGRELNQPRFGADKSRDRFAPWGRAKIVVFYPEPLGRAPAWGKHFVAYVRGANGIPVLPGEEAKPTEPATSQPAEPQD